MQTFEHHFLLHVPSSTDNLAMIRDFVASVGEKAGFDEKEVMKLSLAVDEACANVIEHAYGEEATAKYADGLSKRIRNGEFTVEVVHQ
jgi:anti-sigma regulatory factor (Ser/Thr protein kinase)